MEIKFLKNNQVSIWGRLYHFRFQSRSVRRGFYMVDVAVKPPEQYLDYIPLNIERLIDVNADYADRSFM